MNIYKLSSILYLDEMIEAMIELKNWKQAKKFMQARDAIITN